MNPTRALNLKNSGDNDQLGNEMEWDKNLSSSKAPIMADSAEENQDGREGNMSKINFALLDVGMSPRRRADPLFRKWKVLVWKRS